MTQKSFPIYIVLKFLQKYDSPKIRELFLVARYTSFCVLTALWTRLWIECVIPDLADWQSFSEELEVVLVFPLNLFLAALAHPVPHVALEPEAQRHHGVADAGKNIEIILNVHLRGIEQD